MKVPVSWFNDYTEVDVSAAEFQHLMTMSGTKVEAVENLGEGIVNVVSGRVLEISAHPDADKLVVCLVDVGEEKIQIVTGATNLFVGAVVPVAKDGAVLPSGTKIKKGKLRGVESFGMMCSDDELFPGRERAEGIMILPEGTPLGLDIKEILGLDDLVAEFEITSNRPDCHSVIGIAREVAATLNHEFNLQKPQIKEETENTDDYIKIDVQDYELCPRYTARMVKDLKIEPSPEWLSKRLEKCGIRSINNIVDITNYVMLEYGQPMHAFDFRDIRGGEIIVRRATEGETITTLDDQERLLDSENLVIADSVGATAVAGVMGGLNSEIKEDTTTILFESANFLNASVRRTAKKLGLRTESSARYEKGISPEMTLDAVNRACELVEMLGAGKVIGGIIDKRLPAPQQKTISFNPDKINEFLGTEISREFMIDTFSKLDIEIKDDSAVIPYFRDDIEGTPDLAEEVARFYGYDNIPSTLLDGKTTLGGRNESQLLEQKVQTNLVAQGFHEILTYSFVDEAEYSLLGIEPPEFVRISNPLGAEHGIMRTNTIGSMLNIIRNNYNHRVETAAFFEIGKVYLPCKDEELPEEKLVVTLGMYGGTEYLDIKGAVDVLLENLGIIYYDIEREEENPIFHPGRSAKLSLQKKPLALVGQIHPDVLKRYAIDTDVYVATIDFNMLLAHKRDLKKFKALPKYPATSRDIAFMLDVEIPVRKIEDTIKSVKSNIIEEIKLFDVYTGQQVQAGYKSVAYSIRFRAQDRTLTDDEVSEVMRKIEDKLKEGLDVQFRQ